MIERAAETQAGPTFRVADIDEWSPADGADLIFSNAALHWLDGHDELFPRLRSLLRRGGVLAVQMPDNWREPTHRIPAEVLDTGEWPTPARDSLLRDRLSTPAEYAAWIAPGSLDMWRTTYYQQLTGDDPVWEWVTGSALRPVLAALVDGDRERFTAEVKARYRLAYPAQVNGRTILPFSRLFLVLRAD